MTSELPKCMIPVMGESILGRAIRVLEHNGVQRLAVVTGHQRGILEDCAATLATHLEIQFIHSPDYATTNNIVSLWRVADAVQEDFLLLESDLVFKSAVLQALRGGTAAAVSPLCDWMDGTVLTVDKRGCVERMHFKNELRPDGPVYKTVNIYRIGAQDWRDVIWPALDAAVQAGDVDSYYERIFANVIAGRTLNMRASVCDADTWREVDTPDDLRATEAWTRM